VKFPTSNLHSVRRLTWTILLALTVCSLCDCSPKTTARADEPLRWKLTKGETLRYRRVQERPVTNTVGTREVKTQTNRTTDLSLTVTDVDAKGVASVSMKITRLRVSKKMPTGEGSFDTDAPEKAIGDVKQIAPGAKLLAGTEYSFQLTPQGKVEKFELTAATKEKFKAAPGLDDKTLKLLVPTLPVPDGTVSRDQEWTQADSLSIPSIGELKLDRKYKYLGEKPLDGVTLPEVRSTIAVDLKAAKGPLANAQIDDWTHEGTYRFDRKQGRLVSQKDVGRMTMTVKANGQSIPSVAETIEAVTLLKDNE
jgi:hypothetical protein